MSIHNIEIGSKFFIGRYSKFNGDIDISDELILVWKGQFAYPSYRYINLRTKKELSGTDNGNEIFKSTFEEVVQEIENQCTKYLNRYQKILDNLKLMEQEKYLSEVEG